jgi:SOS-response transcriptional repressor LexA
MAYRTTHNGPTMQSIIGYMKNQPKHIVGERLTELMASVPSLSTQQKIAARTGIGQSTIGRIRRGEVNATLDNVKRIATAFNVQISYLYGETDERGSMQVDIASKNEMRDTGPAPSDEGVMAGPEIRGRLPLISWTQAGEWSEIANTFQPGDAEDWLPCPFDHGPHAFILPVVGESNYDPAGTKSYGPGEFIAVDPARAPVNRSMVVVRVDLEERTILRQLLKDEDGTMLLKALNPNWPNRMLPMPDGSRISGVVIGKWVPE